MKKIILLFVIIWESLNINLHAEKDLYVEAFTRFVDTVLCFRFEKGDTICVKETFGITEKIPSEIGGYKIRIVNEFECENMPTKRDNKGNLYRQVFYIYPMNIYHYSWKKEPVIGISINDNLILNEKNESRYNSPHMLLFNFEFIFEEETKDIYFWRYGCGGFSGRLPWLINE